MKQLKLSKLIEDRGFPEDYAEHFVSRIEEVLDTLDEGDRLILESYIPVILEYGEESWLPKLPSVSKLLNKVLDPSLRPQSDGNRE